MDVIVPPGDKFCAAQVKAFKHDEQEDRMTETHTSTHISQVGTVIVPVSDQDRAIDFYVEKLGFEKRLDMPFGHGDRWVEVGPAGAATTVALIPPREGEPTGVDTRVAFSTQDIDSDHATLKARGVDVDGEVMRMGDPVPPMFFFRDQDGNTLLMVETG
jgi:catechol 2,3-dioxygenase-like lactoylglutathione lyase family enzyme